MTCKSLWMIKWDLANIMSHLGAGSSCHLAHILVTHVSHVSHPGYPPLLWPIGAYWCRVVRTHIIIDSLSQEWWSAMKHNELKCLNYPWHGLWHFSAFSAGWHYPGPVWSPWLVNTRGPGSLAGASRSVTLYTQYDDRTLFSWLGTMWSPPPHV